MSKQSVYFLASCALQLFSLILKRVIIGTLSTKTSYTHSKSVCDPLFGSQDFNLVNGNMNEILIQRCIRISLPILLTGLKSNIQKRHKFGNENALFTQRKY